MALFLESGISTQSSTKYNGLSLTECLCEGINLTQEMMELQEAVFKADFILHSRNQGLSESVQALNEAGFLSSVWEKTKSMLKRVWDWIKATWNKLTAKVTEWANRIGDLLAGKTKEVKKSVIKTADLIETFGMKVIDKILSTASKVSANPDVTVTDDLVDEISTLDADLKEALTEAGKLEGREKVSATFAKKIDGVAKRIGLAATKAVSSLVKLEASIDKEMKSIKGSDNTTPIHTKTGEGDSRQYTTPSGDGVDKGDKNASRTAQAQITYIKRATTILNTLTSTATGTIQAAVSALGGKVADTNTGLKNTKTAGEVYED